MSKFFGVLDPDVSIWFRDQDIVRFSILEDHGPRAHLFPEADRRVRFLGLLRLVAWTIIYVSMDQLAPSLVIP